jgi:hypothetical protein
MTTVRKINVSQVEGDNANNTSTDEIRPYGELAVYIGDNDKLELLMADGVRTNLRNKVMSKGTFYGGDADSGDGAGLDTIKLIPDAALHYNDSNYNNDQYLIIDPTAPNHIHIRAGGTIDNSNADLFLGGERNNVKVSDGYDNVQITTDAGEGTYTWTFDNSGDLTFPGSSNARIGDDEPGLVVYSENGFAVLTNADPVSNYQVEFIGYVSNGFGDSPGATLTVTEVIVGSITDGMTIYGAGLPEEGWTVTFGSGVMEPQGTGGTGNYLLAGANILTASQSFNNGVAAAGSQSWIFDDAGTLVLPDGGQILSDIVNIKGFDSVKVKATSPLNPLATKDWTFDGIGRLTFPDATVQTTAYAGGVGRAMMIDTNRTDSYTEVGSADRPFKTFAAAIAAADASAATAYTFILMGCTVTEDVDFGGTAFTQITISTTCRSVITGNVTINNNSDLSQLVIRNIEIGGTFTLAGDGTENQMNSCSFYNVSFTGAVNITATNASAFYEVSFFNTVNFTNLSYLYINGAQFNTDWTITADSDGVIPSRGINPGTGGSIAIVFSVIANNVIFVKGGTAAYVFQPHMSRMGLGAGTYTVPAGWTMTPHSTVLRGTWVNNGTVAMRNSSSDLAITGVARSYTGIIGGDRVVADLVPANSTGAAGDAAGMIAVGGGYLYVCTANWASPGTADIWTRTSLTTGSW